MDLFRKICRRYVRHDRPYQLAVTVIVALMFGIVATAAGWVIPATSVFVGMSIGFWIRWIARPIVRVVVHICKAIASLQTKAKPGAERARARAQSLAFRAYELRVIERRLESLTIINYNLTAVIVPSPVF